MKIELISPFLRIQRNIGEAFHLPQMALALIAKLTPPEIDISITDELVQPIAFDKKIDLVGITVNTKTAVRAYEIADKFQNRGIPVVLGGIHPKVAPLEAIKHADALILGEAEGLWQQLLEDFKKKELKKFYNSDVFPDLSNCPFPRRDLFQRDQYLTINLIQTSRGCPYACHFCSVSTLYGKGIRFRPVDNVIKEIETLNGNDLFFVDDNVVGKKKYAKQFLARLEPLKKKWIGQAPVTVANDDEILKLLQKSGCEGLFVGFETNSIASLKEVGKVQNLNNNYFESIKKFHDQGISILGSFIVGFDNDDKYSFEGLLEFVFKGNIDIVDISMLTPYPETVLYNKLKKEKRLIDDRWWLKYDSEDVVFKPRLMTREELYEGRVWALKEFYKIRPIFSRLLQGIGRRSLFGHMINWKANMGYRMNAYAVPPI